MNQGSEPVSQAPSPTSMPWTPYSQTVMRVAATK